MRFFSCAQEEAWFIATLGPNFGLLCLLVGASLVAQWRICLMQETWVWSLGREDSLAKEMATHSSVLAQRITWAQEPGGLQSMGEQRVGHDWATNISVVLGKAPIFFVPQFSHLSHFDNITNYLMFSVSIKSDWVKSTWHSIWHTVIIDISSYN